jgi:hypothetical protein
LAIANTFIPTACDSDDWLKDVDNDAISKAYHLPIPNIGTGRRFMKFRKVRRI